MGASVQTPEAPYIKASPARGAAIPSYVPGMYAVTEVDHDKNRAIDSLVRLCKPGVGG